MGINPAVGRADNASRGARKRRHVVGTKSESLHRELAAPVRFARPRRRGRGAGSNGGGGGIQGHEIPGT